MLVETPPPRMADPGRPVWQIAALLFLLALTVRVVDLGGRSLWVDEGATAILSGPTLSEIVEEPDTDTAHPPGYYALIHLTSRISDSETGLRLPSALISSITVAAVYVIGRRLGGATLGLVAAVLLLLSPLDLWYAQEARQPVFAAAAVIAAGWGLINQRWLGTTVGVVTLLAGLYLDYITAAAWFGLGAIAAVMARRGAVGRFRDWVTITVVTSVIYIPFQGRQFSDGFQDLLTHEGAGIWYGEILGSNPVTSSAPGLLVLGGLAIFAVVVVADYLTTRPRMGKLWVTVLVAGFALGSALSPIPRAYSVKKVIVVGWPVLALLIAFLLVRRLGPGWRRRLLVGVVALSAVGSVGTFLIPKDDWRGATAHVNDHAAPGDVAWVREDVWAADAYLYYGGILPVSTDPTPDDDLPETGDVWLITYRRPQDPAVGPSIAAEAWFDENWVFVEEIPFYRLSVRRYQTP
ncbi:MAG: glycosyltransferase family 39 protein [Actinobacteria bacterium]|nr:glycosyltransferase family 39 protein [Actinomycetota bacterium]